MKDQARPAQPKKTGPTSPSTFLRRRVWNEIFAAGDRRCQRGPEDDVSAQRPEIGDHHTREIAAKTAFLPASYQLRVSEDWVVETERLELAAHQPVIEPVSMLESGNFNGGDRATKSAYLPRISERLENESLLFSKTAFITRLP
jgi:hypothetical protein